MEKASEGPVRITKATVDAAWRRRRPDFRLTIRDTECRGLALVVNPTSMSWVVSYKPRGLDPRTGKRPATRELVVGAPATHSPEQARQAAAKVKGEAKGGTDPATVRREKIAKAALDRAATVDRLVEDYTTALPSRPKLRGTGLLSPAVQKAELQQVKQSVETMKAGNLPVSAIGAREIRSLLIAEAKRPATARHRFGALSRFLDWCQDEGMIALNPCLAISKGRRPRAPKPRSHHLPLTDLARLWHAAGTAEADLGETGFLAVHRDLIRCLIALPCRRGEAAKVDWSHLDLEAGAWIMPGKLTKNGDPHRLPLPYIAHVLLLTRWETGGRPKTGLVFPSPKAGAAISTWSDMKAAMDKASGLTGWRWHDFRRSFVTVLAEHGVAEAVADAMLNHRQAATRGGVLGVYQQARRLPEQEAAMRRWNELLMAAVEGRPDREAVVVPLSGRGL
ncbi:tyrosine-type recombinase/integrase [Roseomonas xinghualingensis]|uniref:tyrosine-type recombinase/integrase n=1 Tax=Roseomonas xinghualingensis TaxID=2986475 RepID=UPI0021F22EB6|nr:site-specific integrase [Roseomonas sp. SXEYE001]